MKAIIWGSCGSLPSPTSSASIRQKVKDAIWTSRELEFASIEAVDAYLETLPHSAHGTYLNSFLNHTFSCYGNGSQI